MTQQVLKRRGRGGKPPKYGIFVDRRGGEPVLISRKDYSRREAQSKVANLRRGLKGMEDSGAQPLIIHYVKQDTR